MNILFVRSFVWFQLGKLIFVYLIAIGCLVDNEVCKLHRWSQTSFHQITQLCFIQKIWIKGRGLSVLQRELVSSYTPIGCLSSLFLQNEKIALLNHLQYMSRCLRSTRWVVTGTGKSDLGFEKRQVP